MLLIASTPNLEAYFKQEAAVETENCWKLKPSVESCQSFEAAIKWQQGGETSEEKTGLRAGQGKMCPKSCQNTLPSVILPSQLDESLLDIHNPSERMVDQPTKISYRKKKSFKKVFKM